MLMAIVIALKRPTLFDFAMPDAIESKVSEASFLYMVFIEIVMYQTNTRRDVGIT